MCLLAVQAQAMDLCGDPGGLNVSAHRPATKGAADPAYSTDSWHTLLGRVVLEAATATSAAASGLVYTMSFVPECPQSV